jgi:hypothetical protein
MRRRCSRGSRVGSRPSAPDRRRRDRRHLLEHREEARQEVRAGGHQAGDVGGGQAAERLRHVVGDAVEGLEGHRLALVAAARQHQRRRDVGLAHRAREGADQRRLADARLAEDEHQPRSQGGAVPGGGQRGELLVAADQLDRRHQRRRRRDGGRPRLGVTEAAGDGRPAGPPLGLDLQEVAAQRGQIGRDTGLERLGRHRLDLLLVDEDLQEVAAERHPSGQRLVQHRAHRVPVGGGGDADAGGLLGRHVVDGADGATIGGLPRRIGVGDQAEVEEDDAAGAIDHDVRRLHVAVDQAGVVQDAQAAHQLAQGVAQAPLVEAGAGDLGDGRCPRPHVLEEVAALDELHREEPALVVADQLAEGDQVRVGQALQHAELALEAGQRVRVGVGQRLQRDPLTALAIERLVHLAHATGAQAPLDLEPLGERLPGDDHAGGERSAVAAAPDSGVFATTLGRTLSGWTWVPVGVGAQLASGALVVGLGLGLVLGLVARALGVAAAGGAPAPPEAQARAALLVVRGGAAADAAADRLVVALEPDRRLHAGVDARVALAVGHEADLGADLERQRGEELGDLLAQVHVLEEVADLAGHDLEHLVLRAVGGRRQIARDVGDRDVLGQLAQVLLGGEQRAQAGGECALHHVGHHGLQALPQRLGELLAIEAVALEALALGPLALHALALGPVGALAVAALAIGAVDALGPLALEPLGALALGSLAALGPLALGPLALGPLAIGGPRRPLLAARCALALGCDLALTLGTRRPTRAVVALIHLG